ncbi:hypothetical protein A2U01_0110228, partial [Trifolium medium]|nr:hypothetical protein [Trifolium medium]
MDFGQIWPGAPRAQVCCALRPSLPWPGQVASASCAPRP